MAQSKKIDKDGFLYPCNRYHGQFKPESLVSDANSQEFAQRVSYIYNLENSGKLNPEEAYQRIETLWKQIERTKKQLEIGESPFQSREGNE